MSNSNHIENLIRTWVPLGKTANTGFEGLKCPMCVDYKVRAGFKFDNGDVGYSCFNCHYKARYSDADGNLSNKMRRVLLSCGIPEDEIDKTIASSFIKKISNDKHISDSGNQNITLNTLNSLKLNTPEVPLPPGAILLSTLSVDDPVRVKYEHYINARGLSIEHHNWYICHPINNTNAEFKDRLIIPIMRNGKCIYWQSRSISPLAKKRYINSSATKAAVFHGYDKLNFWSNRPLFVTEGIFDALSLDCICILGSTLSKELIHLFKHTRRRLIFVIDKDKNGKDLATLALENGWEITFTPSNTSDANDSLVKCGKIYTIEWLINSACSGFIAKTRIILECKK